MSAPPARDWMRGADEHREKLVGISIAAWLRRADWDGSLEAFLNPSLTPLERTMAQVEGWILGVA